MSESPANIIHQGQVSSYDSKKHTARVAFDDWEGVVSGDLQIMQPGSTRMRVKQPLQVGDHVLCMFQANGLQEGYILGSPYTSSNMPDDGGDDDYVMSFPDKDVTIRINSSSGKVEVLAPNSEVVGTAKNTSMDVKENASMKVGKALTAEAQTANVKASQSAAISAPQIGLNGQVTAHDESGGGDTTVTLNGTVTIRGQLNVIGNQSTTGNIDASGDVKAGNISLKGHVHSGVERGGGKTDQPV